MNFNGVVLSGGGYKGYIHLGALSVLYGELPMDEVSVYSGTSVGALICFLLALGYNPKQILGAVITDDILKSKTGGLLKITSNFGILSMDCIVEKISKLASEEELNLTFEELLERTGKHFCCCATNLDDFCAQYFSPRDSPGLRCIDAVLASCCLPCIFQSQKIGGKTCIDGGSADNFPHEYTQNYLRGLGKEPKIFGSIILNRTTGEVKNFLDFLFRSIYISIHSRYSKYEDMEDVILVDDQTKTNKYDLFDIGARACQKYILQED